MPFTNEQINFLKSLNSEEKIQDYLDSLDYNWCIDKYICKSPKRVLEEKSAHCLEGALFAAAANRINNKPPLVMELSGDLPSSEHIIAPFQKNGLWGAIAQSRYYTLSWRDPVYKNIRELALSYLPVYYHENIHRLRTYTNPIDLSVFDYMDWMTTDKCLEELGNKFDEYLHIELFEKNTPMRKPIPGYEKAVLRKIPPKEFKGD